MEENILVIQNVTYYLDKDPNDIRFKQTPLLPSLDDDIVVE
jgi:hypothetical protein